MDTDLDKVDTEEVSYGRRLRDLAELRGDRTAMVFAATDGAEQRFSFAELDRRSNQVARLLADAGAGEASTVVVALKNSPEHLFATFGAWKLGASVLPLRYDLPAWERDRLLELVPGAVVVGDGEDRPEGAISSSDLAATGGRDDGPLPDRVPACARLIATSGSTGRPKIVVTPQPGLHTGIPPGGQALGLITGAVYLDTSPLYHTNGFAYCYPPLLSDNLVVLMERFDAAQAVDLIERYRVSHTVMVPTMLQRVARLEGVRDRDLSSIERLVYGGAVVAEWVVRAWLELIPPAAFWFTYGASEGLGLCVCTGEEWLAHPGTVGRPAGCELKILGEDGREVPAGEVGEIYLRPEGDEPRFRYVGVETPAPTADGYWTIGDLGRVDEDGYLYIADRRQDMIVSGGANVYPAEVEAALSEHPGVADVVVIGLPDAEWGHRVHAIVQPADGAALSDDDLRAHCRARLAAYKVPKGFEIVARLPRTAAGKINRSALVAERVS